jgi:hypothetical protein
VVEFNINIQPPTGLFFIDVTTMGYAHGYSNAALAGLYIKDNFLITSILLRFSRTLFIMELMN